MATPADREPQPTEADDGAGVLANLPRARPQRDTPRRAAARERAAAPDPGPPAAVESGEAPAGSAGAAPSAPRGGGAASGAGKRAGAAKRRSTAAGGKGRAGAKPRAKPTTRRARRPLEEPVPRQGFASDDERARGPVQPPGGPELLASAAEIVGELAKAGVGAGERLVRDLLSRLPGS
jgi:hypothetical protein